MQETMIMFNKNIHLLALLTALFFWPCTKLVAAVPVCADPQATLLWQVTNAQMARKGVNLHLFGSIHVGKADFYPLHPLIETEFRNADHLVFEIDPAVAASPQVAMNVQRRGMLPTGQRLQEVVSVATYTNLQLVLANLGIPEASVLNFKPWLLALLLTNVQSSAMGYSADDGLEMYFTDHKSPHSSILELESMEQQLSMLDSLNPEIFLTYTINEIRSSSEQLDELVNAWRCADKEKLAALLFADLENVKKLPAREQELVRELYKGMFTERNLVMAKGIEDFIDVGSGSYFVVIGAGHLVGPGSVVELLQNQGYQVTPVSVSP